MRFSKPRKRKHEKEAATAPSTRKIVIHHEAIDGAKGFKKFNDLKWARQEAQKWVGKHPEIGSTYAVSGDGIVKVMVEGAALSEIFPAPANEAQVFAMKHQPEPQSETERVEQETLEQQAINHEIATFDQMQAEEAEQARKESNSVVSAKFKDRYIANAKEQGIKGKAARRSNWDWLAQEIAKECLDSKGRINMDSFLAILTANGIDHAKWDNRSRGWEGRLRMTGRVALQRIIADSGILKIGGETKEVPPDFRNKYKTKE